MLSALASLSGYAADTLEESLNETRTKWAVKAAKKDLREQTKLKKKKYANQLKVEQMQKEIQLIEKMELTPTTK